MQSINTKVSLGFFLFLSISSFSVVAQDVCFTLERGKDCGTSDTGTTITCGENGEGGSGPAFVRIAAATYTCKPAIRGTSGNKSCNNTGVEVKEVLKTYTCRNGTYQPAGNDTVLSTCKSAKLDGGSCTGTATTESSALSAMDELLMILDSFE